MPPIDAPLAGEVACVDLETTGGHAQRDRIIEAGIVLLSDGEVVEEYSTLVNPGVRIPWAIQQFTGISDAMVADAPPFAAVGEELLRRLAGRLFVAHNAPFDYGFLRGEFRRLGRPFRARVLCTVRLSRALTPGERGHNLDAVMQRHGIACSARHRALGDARVLADFLGVVRRRWPPDRLEELVAELTRRPGLPPQLDADLVDELPEGPGVYLCHGEGDVLLYVGKAKNIQSRVLAHFAGGRPSRRGLELSRLVRRIEWMETAGEFGALLAEVRLVKQRRPLLNRRLRASPTCWAIRLGDDAYGPRATIEELDPGVEDRASYGLFRSRRDAQSALAGIVRDQQLCAKRLGIETGGGSCVGYQFGRCRGACVGREPSALHALRARMALARLKRRDWPFAGRIGIREQCSAGEAVHVFEDWCYLGGLKDPTDVASLQPVEAVFDQDIYRILLRAIGRPAAGLQILELGRP